MKSVQPIADIKKKLTAIRCPYEVPRPIQPRHKLRINVFKMQFIILIEPML